MSELNFCKSIQIKTADFYRQLIEAEAGRHSLNTDFVEKVAQEPEVQVGLVVAGTAGKEADQVLADKTEDNLVEGSPAVDTEAGVGWAGSFVR